MKLAADRDRRLGLVRDAVVLVLQPQPVPVHGGVQVAVVGDVDDDLRALPRPSGSGRGWSRCSPASAPWCRRAAWPPGRSAGRGRRRRPAPAAPGRVASGSPVGSVGNAAPPAPGISRSCCIVDHLPVDGADQPRKAGHLPYGSSKTTNRPPRPRQARAAANPLHSAITDGVGKRGRRDFRLIPPRLRSSCRTGAVPGCPVEQLQAAYRLGSATAVGLLKTPEDLTA